MTESELREQVGDAIAEAQADTFSSVPFPARAADAVLPFIADAEASGRANATADVAESLRERADVIAGPAHHLEPTCPVNCYRGAELRAFADRLTAGESDDV